MTALIVSEGITIGGKSMREHPEAINYARDIYLPAANAVKQSLEK
jgi:hypothetical protein